MIMLATGTVPGLEEHFRAVWKQRPSARRKIYWAAGWLAALFVVVTINILTEIYGGQ